QSINQSLSAPSFSTDWIIRGVFPCYRDRERADIPLDDLADDAGRMYYIGYNENFGNYRSGGDWPFNTFTTKPETPRLRIGLAHGGEDDDAREDVKFDTYLLRLIDEDGDIVAEGDDVPTMASDYGQTFQEGFIIQNLVCTEGYYDNYLVLGLDYNTENGYTHINFQIPQGEQQRANLLTAKPINNVRINDGGAILPAAHQNASLRKSADHAAPSTMVTSVNVDSHRAGIYLPPRRTHIGISRSIPWSRTGPTPSKPGPSTRTARY
ncbi:MAG: hypothetical protein OXG36_00240, partial [Caldilineaceae bacterium]|nr:hypothetical protein [Caldilineaceae bacterium]